MVVCVAQRLQVEPLVLFDNLCVPDNRMMPSEFARPCPNKHVGEATLQDSG